MDEVENRLKNKEEAKKNIDKLFSNWNEKEVIYGLDEYGRTRVRLQRGNAKWYYLNSDSDYDNLPKAGELKKNL